MATPYFQMRLDEVPSTQDVAREELDELPLLVLAGAQTRGRGRSGAGWENADRSLAASLAFRHEPGDGRPFSLMAGIAATRATRDTSLKWPNDVLLEERKVGGILVERSDTTTVIGMGINLWWPEAPQGARALFDADPGEASRNELGALWGAELMELIDDAGWPIDSYRELCVTLGKDITWEPNGQGKAVDITTEGGLVVETPTGQETIYSGSIRHIRES